jgi:DNA transformation protein and related proteins
MKRRRLAPLRNSKSFPAFVLDQLSALNVTSRAMFGGIGLYSEDLFFGIIARDTLFLKVDDTNRADFINAGMQPFKPSGDDAGTMKYYAVPLEVLESVVELERWARGAIQVAHHARLAAAGRARTRR